jgi:hypothetical protein
MNIRLELTHIKAQLSFSESEIGLRILGLGFGGRTVVSTKDWCYNRRRNAPPTWRISHAQHPVLIWSHSTANRCTISKYLSHWFSRSL